MKDVESKSGGLSRKIARDLLAVDDGGRIPTTSALADSFGVGFGTVEKALASLRSFGAIDIKPRGSQGTLLVGRSLPKQWQAAGLGTILAVLPLPNALTFMATATALADWFRTVGLPFAISHRNGATVRLQLLLEQRADIVVTSKRSADKAMGAHPELVALCELAPKSYYAGHEIVTRRGDGTTGYRRVGVDQTSPDHITLCKAAFPEAEPCNIPYLGIPAALVRGDIDVSLLHSRSLVAMELAGDLAFAPLETDGMDDAASATVALCHHENSSLRNAIRAAGGLQDIGTVHEQVMTGRRNPEY